MTPTEYAHEIIGDTMHLRPSDAGCVRYVKAESGLGTFWLELTSEKVWMGTPSEARDTESYDFLLDTSESLESLQTFAELVQAAA